MKKTIVKIKKGKRNFIHPILKYFDDIDCEFTYNQSAKIMIVDYFKIDGKYTKTMMTNDPISLKETVQKDLSL